MKTCYRCEESKPLSEYSLRDKARQVLHNVCKDCHRKYRREHYLKNRQKYIDKAVQTNKRTINRNRPYIVEWLKSHPCVDCGESDIEVLQFDHVEPLRSRNGRVNNYKTYSLARIQQEIAKCEVRCANCHVRRTRRMEGWSYEI